LRKAGSTRSRLSESRTLWLHPTPRAPGLHHCVDHNLIKFLLLLRGANRPKHPEVMEHGGRLFRLDLPDHRSLLLNLFRAHIARLEQAKEISHSLESPLCQAIHLPEFLQPQLLESGFLCIAKVQLLLNETESRSPRICTWRKQWGFEEKEDKRYHADVQQNQNRNDDGQEFVLLDVVHCRTRLILIDCKFIFFRERCCRLLLACLCSLLGSLQDTIQVHKKE
jgi:hypothetical protein